MRTRRLTGAALFTLLPLSASAQQFQVERPVDALDAEPQQSWSLDLTEAGAVLTSYRDDDWKRTKALVSRDGERVGLVLPQPRDPDVQPPVMWDVHRHLRAEVMTEDQVVLGDGTAKVSGIARTGFFAPLATSQEFPALHWNANGPLTGWYTRGVANTDPMLVVGQAGYFEPYLMFRYRGFAARVSRTDGALDPNGPVELPSISHDRARSILLDVNDSWEAVGWAEDALGVSQAISWEYPNGPVVQLGTLGGPGSEANAIDEHGTIVGQADLPDGSHHAFLHRDGAMTDLGTLGGASSAATAISDRGHVVGWSWTAEGGVHAFLVTDGGAMRDLNELIPTDSGWTLQYATAVNRRGQIVGWGRIDGETHGFLLTPLALPGW